MLAPTQQTDHSQFAGQNMKFVNGKWEIKGGPGSYSSHQDIFIRTISAAPIGLELPALKAKKWWSSMVIFPDSQWEFQDPKMEVLYHTRLYFVGIFPYIGLI